MKAGYIPKNITFYCQKDRLSINVKDTDVVIENIFNSFPVDPEKNIETAKQWSMYNTGENTLAQPIKFDYENEPIKNVRIVGWESRTYGVQYKAIVRDKFYVDLGVEVVMDIISNCTITNGVVSCDMIFVKQHSTMKLVRVGSEIHKTFSKKESQEVLYSKNLKPMNVYKSTNGDVAFVSNKVMYTAKDTTERYGRNPFKRKSYVSQDENKFVINSNTFDLLLGDLEVDIQDIRHYDGKTYEFPKLKSKNGWFYFHFQKLPDTKSKIKFYHDKEITKEDLHKILNNLENVDISDEHIIICPEYLTITFNLLNVLEIKYEDLPDKFKIVVNYFKDNGYAYGF